MADFENHIQDAIAAEEIPGCVLTATNRDGSFTYSRAYGNTSMKLESAKPLGLDTIMWVASCTKLMTSLCAMQLVEAGQVSLDEPVYKHIPELESLKVLKSFTDAGEPIEEKHTNPITLRRLLSHSSGLTYASIHPKAMAWLKYHNREDSNSGKLLERFDCPLMFEPGEAWCYGPSIDFAGLLVERVTGQTLEEYMKKNLWEPLNIRDMTFKPSSRPDLQERMADMSVRDETGKVRWTGAVMVHQGKDGKEAEDCFGGHGCFTSAEEYLKVLHAVLNRDEKILKKETFEEFFRPQLSEGSAAALNHVLQDDAANNAMGGAPKDGKKDWGLGGLLLVSSTPNNKQAGTMIWGGLPNLIWWIDPKVGVCGLYAGQVLPPGDAKCAALTRKFEEGIYAMLAKQDGEARL